MKLNTKEILWKINNMIRTTKKYAYDPSMNACTKYTNKQKKTWNMNKKSSYQFTREKRRKKTYRMNASTSNIQWKKDKILEIFWRCWKCCCDEFTTHLTATLSISTRKYIEMTEKERKKILIEDMYKLQWKE